MARGTEMVRRDADENRYKWKEVPATYVDTFEVAVISDAKIARLAFGEFAGRGNSFLRVAVAMPISDAKALVRILGDLIRDMDAEESNQDGDDVRPKG